MLTPAAPLPTTTTPVRTGTVAVKATAAKGGAVKLTLSVVKGATAAPTVQLRARLRVGKTRKTVVVGSARATLGDGASKTLTLKLNAKGRAALKRAGKLKLQVVVSAKSAAGKTVTTTKTVTVKR